MASSLPCKVLSSGQTEVDSLEGQAGNMGKVILGPSLPTLPSQGYLLYLDLYALLVCLPRDCIHPFYNFILTSILKLLLPFPQGLDWNSIPKYRTERGSGMAFRNMAHRFLFCVTSPTLWGSEEGEGQYTPNLAEILYSLLLVVHNYYPNSCLDSQRLDEGINLPN